MNEAIWENDTDPRRLRQGPRHRPPDGGGDRRPRRVPRVRRVHAASPARCSPATAAGPRSRPPTSCAEGRESVAELGLEDLAGRALGQLVEDADLAGVLVRGQLLLGVGHDLLRRDRLAGLEADHGHDLLAQPAVGLADHRGLGHRGVGEEHLLDLAGVHVEAAADDHVLLAIDDEEVAVGVAVAEVAGVEPPALHGLGGRVGAAVVALHHVVATDHDLTDVVLAPLELDVVGVDDLHLDAPHRAGRSTGPAGSRRCR